MGCKQSCAVAEHVPASKVSEVEESIKKSGASEPEVENVPTVADEKFAVNGVSIEDKGIVYYHVQTQDGKVSVKRRYNDFKALYVATDCTSLPALPDGSLRSVLKGRHNQDLMKEREAQFAIILNAIANDPVLSQSEEFQKFLTA